MPVTPLSFLHLEGQSHCNQSIHRSLVFVRQWMAAILHLRASKPAGLGLQPSWDLRRLGERKKKAQVSEEGGGGDS